MASSSILGGERAATRAKGRDADSLGPSDSSDSGSDVQGEIAQPTGDEEAHAVPAEQNSDSDAAGTGERAAAVPDRSRDSGDILPDRIDPVLSEDMAAAGLESLDDVSTEDLAVDQADDEFDALDESDDGEPVAT